MDKNFYYDQIKEASLELVEDGKTTKTFLLRKYPDSAMMSTWLVFAPFGIVLGGDLRITQHGLIIHGYGLDWFADQLYPRYLAEKCLERKWIPSQAIQAFRDWADDLENEIKTERDEARQEMIENGTENPTEEDIDGGVSSYAARRRWKIDHEEFTGTDAEAVRKLAENESLFETSEILYDALPAYYKDGRLYCPFDGEDIGRGYDYAEAEVGWLSAIQRRFAECYQAMRGNP